MDMYHPEPAHIGVWYDLRMRWKARRLNLRARRHGRDLVLVKTGRARPGVTLFCTIRNEIERIDWFFTHYRRLGVGHFIFIDNASTDGTFERLHAADDATVYQSQASYKASRFGMDWITLLMHRHGVGRWCLVVDADELLIYPYWQTRPLGALTDWLDQNSLSTMPAMMLELYPAGPLDQAPCIPGTDPCAVLSWFDAGNYTITRKPLTDALLIQGGPRMRHFFADHPHRGPTLTKLPLIKWQRRNIWLNSTHALLPRDLNRAYARDGGAQISGVLLHTKFLATVVEKAKVEKARGEHFGNAPVFDGYYDRVAEAPNLWCEHSTRLEGWEQLEDLGLLSRGGWA